MTPFDAKAVDLSKLMSWYSRHCDGEWEHGYGVSIRSLDNPGWILEINLLGTNLEHADMPAISEDCDDDTHPEISPWIACWIQDKKFKGASDPTQLPRLIAIFNALIDAHELQPKPDKSVEPSD